jgi:hypothetical protein
MPDINGPKGNDPLLLMPSARDGELTGVDSEQRRAQIGHASKETSLAEDTEWAGHAHYPDGLGSSLLGGEAWCFGFRGCRQARTVLGYENGTECAVQLTIS